MWHGRRARAYRTRSTWFRDSVRSSIRLEPFADCLELGRQTEYSEGGLGLFVLHAGTRRQVGAMDCQFPKPAYLGEMLVAELERPGVAVTAASREQITTRPIAMVGHD